MVIGTWEPAAHSFPVERLEEFLIWAAELGASDISFQTAEPVLLDVDGRLGRGSASALDSTGMEMLVEKLFNATGEGILRSGQAIDCSFAVRQGRRSSRRFRVNISPVQVDHGFGVNAVLRVLPKRVPDFAELGTEGEIAEAWRGCRGLTMVTGVPGSGKSTLMAAGTRSLLENNRRADPVVRGADRIHIRRDRRRRLVDVAGRDPASFHLLRGRSPVIAQAKAGGGDRW